MSTLARHRRELAVALAIGVLALVLAVAAPAYFSRANLSDVFLSNLPVLVIALGGTLVLLTGQIDISVGSLFALCAVVAGLLAKAGLPMPLAALGTCLVGAAIGALNGALVAWLRIPSIVVTLAALVALRDGLRWATQGAWVEDLPPGFQWFGLGQAAYPLAMAALAAGLVAALAWGLRSLAAGRAVYATGSNSDAARLVGLDPQMVTWAVFAVAGTLTALASLLNATRFNQIPANSGLGLEMKVIAAIVVGGASIRGGRGTVLGTVLGVVLLGAIGPALTFLGVSAYWERAIQGAIILAAVAADALGATATQHGRTVAASRA